MVYNDFSFLLCDLFFNIPKLPLLKWKNKKEIWYHFMVLDILCSTWNTSIVEAVPFIIVVGFLFSFGREKKQPTPHFLRMLVFSENLLLSVSKYKFMHYCISIVLLLPVQLQHSRFFCTYGFRFCFFFFYIYIFSFSHRSTSRLRKLQDGTQKYKGWVQPEDLVFV